MQANPQEQALSELYEIIRNIVSINSETDPKDILGKIVQSTAKVLNADIVVFHEFVADDGSHSGEFPRSSLSSKSLIYQLLDLNNQSPMIVENLSKQENTFAEMEKIESIIAARLTVGDEILGTISVTYKTPQHFTEEQIKLITLFADQAALAIKHLRLIKGDRGKGRNYQTCFISYSSKDDGFVQKLYKDLTARNVSCWFAPEDLKIGDEFRERIDDAIRIHNKLLVVLSENSINSSWVKKEVETAFEKERMNDHTVLFPVRLDDNVMNTVQAWAADIRRTRHIGDFSKWRRKSSYQNAFERLLKDLKAKD